MTLQIWVKGAAIKSIVSFIGEIQRPSKPSHLLFFREWAILAASVGEVKIETFCLMTNQELSIRNLSGRDFSCQRRTNISQEIIKLRSYLSRI